MDFVRSKSDNSALAWSKVNMRCIVHSRRERLKQKVFHPSKDIPSHDRVCLARTSGRAKQSLAACNENDMSTAVQVELTLAQAQCKGWKSCGRQTPSGRAGLSR